VTESLQNCELNGNRCGIEEMVSSTSVITSWTFQTGSTLLLSSALVYSAYYSVVG